MVLIKVTKEKRAEIRKVIILNQPVASRQEQLDETRA